MFCRKCGNEMQDDSLFCNKCGTKVEPFVKPNTRPNRYYDIRDEKLPEPKGMDFSAKKDRLIVNNFLNLKVWIST